MNTIIQLWPLWLTLIVLAGILAWKRLGEPDTYTREEISAAPKPSTFFVEQRRQLLRARVTRLKAERAIAVAHKAKRSHIDAELQAATRQLLSVEAQIQQEGIAA